MKKEELVRVLKAQQWSKCKGELRVLLTLDSLNYVQERWEQLEGMIIDFIDSIETDGLEE